VACGLGDDISRRPARVRTSADCGRIEAVGDGIEVVAPGAAPPIRGQEQAGAVAHGTTGVSAKAFDGRAMAERQPGSGHRFVVGPAGSRTPELLGSQYVAGRPAAHVRLAPGGLGYFVAAGQECTTGSGPAPDQARVALPNGTDQEIAVAAGPGVPVPSVCTHASLLHVSPIIGSIRATYP
jgi:hypothetical protein